MSRNLTFGIDVEIIDEFFADIFIFIFFFTFIAKYQIIANLKIKVSRFFHVLFLSAKNCERRKHIAACLAAQSAEGGFSAST